jgi:hypothetical protein
LEDEASETPSRHLGFRAPRFSVFNGFSEDMQELRETINHHLRDDDEESAVNRSA